MELFIIFFLLIISFIYFFLGGISYYYFFKQKIQLLIFIILWGLLSGPLWLGLYIISTSDKSAIPFLIAYIVFLSFEVIIGLLVYSDVKKLIKKENYCFVDFCFYDDKDFRKKLLLQGRKLRDELKELKENNIISKREENNLNSLEKILNNREYYLLINFIKKYKR